jgi:hypothetical protein
MLFKNSNKFSNIVFEQYEYYQKMSFRNRCRIVGAEGVIDLSIPLQKGRDQKTLMKDVRISDLHPWQARHWKTIVSCYSRSPWFEFYRDDLEGLYRKPFTFLMDWNWACLEWTLGTLKLPVTVSLSEEYRKEYGEAGWVDWRGRILPKNGTGEELIEGVGQAPLKYRQVFEERVGFIPNLSILDLIFCEGKRSAEMLNA